MPEISAQEWGDYLKSFPDAHVLQSTEWAELKSRFGWKPVRIVTNRSDYSPETQSGAQVLFRSLPLGFTLAYIPKGPVPNSDQTLQDRFLWAEIDSACRSRRAVFLKVEPDILESEVNSSSRSIFPSIPNLQGFRPSSHSIQPPRTLLVQISGNEDDLLARMKQKTRYNIRLAQKKGVVVSLSSDLESFFQLMQVTGSRDQFGVHSQDYYQAVYDLFHPLGHCEVFQAEYEGNPIACLLALARGQRAWYFYGGSADTHRELMPAYLLQWEAIRWARSMGCTVYDLWGVPDFKFDYLESQFTHRSGGLWGVYRFKRGFGGELSRAIGPWDRVYISSMYSLYRLWMRINSSRQEAAA